MSADTHKYGYAAKGSSVVLYRGKELRQFQYYTTTDWPGGLYLSPTFAGSRPGALSATCWAAMVSIGERGYLDAARRILETGAKVRDGIAAIPGVRVLGDPLWVIAFATEDGVDVFQVLENMSGRGWSLNGLQLPPAVHIAITLRHTLPGVADRFLADLRAVGRRGPREPRRQHRDGAGVRHGRLASRGTGARDARRLPRHHLRGVRWPATSWRSTWAPRR